MKLFYYTLLEKLGYYFIKRHINNFIRACSYFKIGYNNFDWDYYYLHEITLFKLKRMQKAFLSDESYHSSVCSNYKPKMKSLALTIKLLEQHKKNEHKFTDLHYKKYEEYFKSNEIIKRETLEQERKELMDAMDIDDRRNEKFLQTAYKIIGKYHNYWWD